MSFLSIAYELSSFLTTAKEQDISFMRFRAIGNEWVVRTNRFETSDAILHISIDR